MAELKTKKTDVSVDSFIDAISDPVAQADCRVLLKQMRAATGAQPKMWGSSIVGFGDYHYTYASGREGDWFILGFSPRKSALTLYASGGWDTETLKKLGKHTVGKGCLYIKRLSDVDATVLKALLASTRPRHEAAVKMIQEARNKKTAGKTKTASTAKNPTKAKPAVAGRVTVRNVNVPGHTSTVDAVKYNAMKTALLKALPKKAPGLTQAEMMAGVLAHASQEHFPGGDKAGWWMKCVQLDLEAQGVVLREAGKPLRWHRK